MTAGQKNVLTTWRVPIGQLSRFPVPDEWLCATMVMETKQAALDRLKADDRLWHGSNVECIEERFVDLPITPPGKIEWSAHPYKAPRKRRR